MMRKTIAVLLAFIMVFSVLGVCAAEEITAHCYELDDDGALMYKKAPIIVGTTPKESSVMLMSSSITEDMVDISTQIYNNFTECEPELFLFNDNKLKCVSGWHEMTDDQLEYVASKAECIMTGCETATEKIRAVAEYVAKNICYDYDYYYHDEKEYDDLNLSAYEVLVNESSVCLGYSEAVTVLLQTAGIPCDIIISPNHAWNMAWNGERWILFDTTWMSNGYYEDGVLHKSDDINVKWYNFTLDDANANYNHLLERASYTEYNNALYDFPTDTLISSFTIPSNIKVIDQAVFYGCSDIELLCNLSLESIGAAAFFYCSKLKGEVNFENVKAIEPYTFYSCTNLDKISGISQTESIGEAAFYKCSSAYGNIEFQKQCYIDDYAFTECPSLESVSGLENITSVGKCGFYGCKKMVGELDIRNAKSIGEAAFYECESLSGVINLENAEKLEGYAFYGCKSAEDVIIGENVTDIPYGAFYNCASTEAMIIPQSVTSIDSFAIANCSDLSDIYYKGSYSDFKKISIKSYNYSINPNYLTYNFEPYISANKSVSNAVVTYKGIPTDEYCYMAEYAGGRLLNVTKAPLEKSMKLYNIKDETSKVKFFVFEQSDSITPCVKMQELSY